MARFYNFLDGFHDFHSVFRRFALQKWNFEGGTFPLSQLRRVMPLKTIVLLINSLVLPHIRFCIALWGNCNVTQGKRIDKIIRFARRIAGREAS